LLKKRERERKKKKGGERWGWSGRRKDGWKRLRSPGDRSERILEKRRGGREG